MLMKLGFFWMSMYQKGVPIVPSNREGCSVNIGGACVSEPYFFSWIPKPFHEFRFLFRFAFELLNLQCSSCRHDSQR